MNAAIEFAADLTDEQLDDLAKLHPNDRARCWAKNVLHSRLLAVRQPLIANVARNKAATFFRHCGEMVEVLGEPSIHTGEIVRWLR